jgi:hypothetical protein
MDWVSERFFSKREKRRRPPLTTIRKLNPFRRAS